MSGDLRISAQLVLPADELRWRFSRSSGPGGQGVNTADSRVELLWEPARSRALQALPQPLRERALERLAPRLTDGLLVVIAAEHRSQLRNREAAQARLAALLRAALRAPPRARRATRPSRGAVERRLAAKKRRAELKRARRLPED